MQIPVLIEPVAGNGYRARSGEPFAFAVEGTTREEALRKLHEAIQGRLVAGADCVPLNVSAGDNPWHRIEGVYQDDPLFDEWQAAIAEYRRQVDQDPGVR